MVGTQTTTTSDTVLFFKTQEVVEDDDESFDYDDDDDDDDYEDDDDYDSGVPYEEDDDDDDDDDDDEDEETLTYQDGFVEYLDDLTVLTPENPDWVMALGKMVEEDKELQAMLNSWLQVQNDNNKNNNKQLQQDPSSSPRSVVSEGPPSSPSRQRNLQQIREALLTVAAANAKNGRFSSAGDKLYSGNSILEEANLVPNEDRMILRRIGSEMYYVADDEDDETYTYDGDETTTIYTSTTTINNMTVNNIHSNEKDKDGCGDPRLMYSLEALMGKIAGFGCGRVVCSQGQRIEKAPLQLHPAVSRKVGMEIDKKQQTHQPQQQQQPEEKEESVKGEVTEIEECQPVEPPVEETEQPEQQPVVEEEPNISSPTDIGQEVLLLEKSIPSPPSTQIQQKHHQRQPSRAIVTKMKKKKGKEQQDDNTTSTKSSSRSGSGSGGSSGSYNGYDGGSSSSKEGVKKMFRFLPRKRSSRRGAF